MGQALRKREKGSREKTRLDGLQTKSPIGPTSADKYVCGRRAAGVSVNASKVISVVCVCVRLRDRDKQLAAILSG